MVVNGVASHFIIRGNLFSVSPIDSANFTDKKKAIFR
jgi:hypothetical protein